MSKKRKQLSFDDWMDRDDDFVHRGNLRSGWDVGYNSTTDYVLGGFLKPVTPEGEIREIRNLCVNRADIIGGDKKIIFKINPEEKTASTTGKVVKVGTAVLDESEKNFSQKADIMVGLTTHEMAHVLYSNFAHLRKVKTHLHKAILNVIEDERIEYLLCKEFPGYANNIADLKKYFLDEKYLIEDGLSKGVFTTEAERCAAELFDMLFKMVRYPKHLNKEAIEAHKEEFEKFKEILNPYPLTPAKTFKASELIYEIISSKIKEELEEPEEKKSEPTSEKPEGEPSETPESKPDEPEETSVEEEDSHKDKIANKIEDTIGMMMSEFESDNDPSKKIPISESVKEIDFSEDFIYDSTNKASFRNGKNQKISYEHYANEIRDQASKLAYSMFTHVFDESSTLRGLRSGSLDENRIVDAVNGVQTVHYKKYEKQTKSVNIVMLIDESGSMSNGRKYEDAAKAAILIDKAFQKFQLGKLFIYGFTGDCRNPSGTYDHNLIIRYREPGLNIPYGLGDIQPRANNRDGECIRAVANRVRQFTNDPMIFFVISDGQPAANSYGGFTDTRNAVKEITKKKFFPIQIGIGSGISPSDQAQMFDDFINYRDPKQMVDDLRKIIIKKAAKVFGI